MQFTRTDVSGFYIVLNIKYVVSYVYIDNYNFKFYKVDVYKNIVL